MSKNYLVWGGAALAVVAGTAVIYLLSQTSVPQTGNAPSNAVNAPPETASSWTVPAASTFGASVVYQPVTTNINAAVAKDFDAGDIQNVKDMEDAYGFTFTSDELAALADRKFVVKNLLDTSIRPDIGGGTEADYAREFPSLYNAIAGSRDYKMRSQANSVFFTSDVFFTSFNNLYTELLKEMENTTFYPSVTSLTSSFESQADAKMKAAISDADKKAWMKVRNYFAVADAIFSTAAQPLSNADYYGSDVMRDPAQVMADWQTKDVTVDTYENAAAFVKKLGLDAESETAVLADVKHVFDADERYLPTVFYDEYKAYAEANDTEFLVDFTQFTPRADYTSSSLRREYFRGMKWYIMLPFFLKSPELTTYAYDVTQLLAENPQALADYNKLEAAINFLVGSSDDLMPADYFAALEAGKGSADPTAAAMEYLVKAHNPKIKDLAALYPTSGTANSADVLLLTKGMRFFSGKFILDSYWTGYLTQGDEAPRPGYPGKLPHMASALEVMTLLGSDYAKTQIPKLDFYKGTAAQAVDKAMGELETQNATLADADWQGNIYYGWLWTIKGLFDWQQMHQDELPRFMQSMAWDAKTLMTANAFWTDLRHATLLYAKQSFAEMGGGGPGACDPRQVPPPPKGYVEPDLEAYNRLSFLAKRLDQGLKDQGFSLTNMGALENFINLMDKAQTFTTRELADETMNETISHSEETDDSGVTCTVYTIDDGSDWEALRIGMVNDLRTSQPLSVEGPILDIKNRRTPLLADVHTGGDKEHPPEILYEGTGVPYVIFTAIEDANGPRLTVGFTSSHYEFREGYGGPRKTDEDWQKNFYQPTENPYDAYQYTDDATWPKENDWYDPLFDLTK